VSRCKPCDKAYNAEYRAARPDKRRQFNRQSYAAIKADPERYAIRMEQIREWKARQRRARGARVVGPRARYGDSGPDVNVPAEPFARWLRERLVGNQYTRLAREVGMHEKRVREILGGQVMVALSTVDAALIAADAVDVLDELYPLDA
jgi:hypothetical protein